jgi:exopolysaccharide production protein ExoZ
MVKLWGAKRLGQKRAEIAKLAVSPKSGELLSIQYMRAIAAIAVLSFHAAQRAGFDFGIGAAGVDVFFVISGFIMWVISARSPLRPMDFLARRAARIVPLYWLVTLVVAGTAIAAPALFPNLKPTLAHVAKSLLFYPHSDPAGFIAPLIVPGWTLNYEVFFYVVFALSLLTTLRIRPLVLTALLGLLVLAGQVAHSANPVWATYSSPLLLEFLSGVWLGKAWTDHRLPRPIVGLICLALGLGAIVIVTLSERDIEAVRIFAWGLPALLIVAGAVSIHRAGLVRDWPVLKFLGDASYSIYLVHGLALSLAARILAIIGIDGAPILFIAGIVGGLGIGSGCYLFVERPMLRFFHRSQRKRREGTPLRQDPFPSTLASAGNTISRQDAI